MKNPQRLCHMTDTHGQANIIVAIPYKEFLKSMTTEDTIDCRVDQFFKDGENRHCVRLRPITDDKWVVDYRINDFEALQARNPNVTVRVKD